MYPVSTYFCVLFFEMPHLKGAECFRVRPSVFSVRRCVKKSGLTKGFPAADLRAGVFFDKLNKVVICFSI